MKSFLFLLALTSVAGFVVTPARAPAARAPRTHVAMAGNPISDAMKRVASFISPKAAVLLPPTADDIEAYCRDSQSTGCDLDLMDALMAEAVTLRSKEAKLEKTREALGDLAAGPVRWHNDDGTFTTTGGGSVSVGSA